MPPAKKLKARRPWQDVAREAQQLRDQSLAQLDTSVEAKLKTLPHNVIKVPEQVLDTSCIAITSPPLEKLLHRAFLRSVTSVEIVRAFLDRATVAQKLTNCITQLLPDRALARAKELDEQMQQGQQPGLLHGLPLSVKSHIGLSNCHVPAGYIAHWEKLAPDDALVVQILERAGAIAIARTTEPQTMMHLECSSNLYGETVNPYNTRTSSGGSSGGEGALIALRGSLLGVGSDVGGSIRVPAAACGIYGLKPTAFRVPTTGWSSTPPGADPIPTVLGPMSSSLVGIELFMRAVLDAEPWKQEPALIPLPWRDMSIKPGSRKPLRLGIMWHDEVVLPHPPITRALREFADRVKKIPYFEVIDFPPYKHDEAWAIVSSLYCTDGGDADLKIMAESGEPLLPLTKWMIKENDCVKRLTRPQLEYWLEEREEFRLEYAKYWNETRFKDGPVDAIISPIAPGVATRPGTAKYWSYSAVWNLLDYPALAFPAGLVHRDIDAVFDRPEFMSDLDEANWKLYDPATFDQMPIGLQIIGRRFDDELIVEILKYLQDTTERGSRSA